jgi:PAS domain S-box-containing protein
MLGLIAHQVWDDRGHALERGRDGLNSSARLAEAKVESLLRGVDGQLRVLRDLDQLTHDIRRGDPQIMQAAFRSATTIHPEVEVVNALDRQGRVLYTSSVRNAFVGTDFSDHDYFREQMNRPIGNTSMDRLIVGSPFVAQVTGKWIVGVSRKTDAAERGGNALVISAMLNPEAIAQILSKLNLGPDGAAAVLHRSGRIIARFPDYAETVGRSMADTRVYKMSASSGLSEGSFSDRSTVDGIERVLSYRALADRQLVVIVGMNEARLLDSWSRYAYGMVLGTLLGVAVWLWLTFLLIRELRDRRSLLNRLSRTNRGLDVAQSTANLGSWEIEFPQERMTMSDHMYRMVGLSREAFSGAYSEFLKLIHWQDRERFDASVRHAAATKEAFDTEHRIVRADGTERLVRQWGSIATDAKTSGIHLDGVAQDVTERAAESRLLAEAEHRYRVMFDDNPLPLLIYDLATLRFRDVNAAAIDTYGYSRERFLDMTLLDLYPADQTLAAFREAKSPPTGRIERRVATHVRANKETIVVEVASCDVALLNASGRLVAAHDITAKLVAEKAREITEARLRAVAQATSDIIWDWNLTDNSVWWNEETEDLFGMPHGESNIGLESWRERIHTDDRSRVVANIERVLAGKEIKWSDEYRFRRRDGVYATVRDRGHIVRNADGKPVHIVCGMEDVTLIRRSEAEMAEARERVRLLSAKVRKTQELERARIARDLHDSVGQTLSALKLGIEGTDPEAAPGAERLARMRDIVSTSIEEVRRMSLDLHPPQLEYLGLGAALRWQLGRQVPTNGPRVEFDIGVHRSVESTVEVACFRIVQEAVNNALKHSKASVIRITLRQDENSLDVRVHDNGVGFDVNEKTLNSLGQVSMRERAELAGGILQVRSSPTEGTEVSAEFRLSAGG